MLIIRKSQMEVFSRQMVKQFEDIMVLHLREDLEDRFKDLSEEDLRAFIRKGVSKAKNYGIERECDIEGFIDLMALLGPDFDVEEEFQWARDLLIKKDMQPEARLNEIFERIEA
jgi:hypothetical protein